MTVSISLSRKLWFDKKKRMNSVHSAFYGTELRALFSALGHLLDALASNRPEIRSVFSTSTDCIRRNEGSCFNARIKHSAAAFPFNAVIYDLCGFHRCSRERHTLESFQMRPPWGKLYFSHAPTALFRWRLTVLLPGSLIWIQRCDPYQSRQPLLLGQNTGELMSSYRHGIK